MKIIQTSEAPKAIGPYSQAVQVDRLVFISGQIPLDPVSMEMVEGDISVHTHQVFKNLKAIVVAAGGSLSDIVKLTIYLTDMTHFAQVNTVMMEYFKEPYPARAAIAVSALPKNAIVEVEAILSLR